MNNFGDFNLFVPVLAIAVPCLALGFFIGSVMFADSGVGIIQKQAIENNCAQYNPTNGTFEWIKK
jgi:hypothetical protein